MSQARKVRAYALQRATYYVFQRGRRGGLCFSDDACYDYYLLRLFNCLRAFRLQLHSYVLLANEQHLLITPFSVGAIDGMLKAVNSSYCDYFTNRFDRPCSLSEASRRIRLLCGGNLVIDCQKYMELLPVREGLVQMPGEYPWSGYGTNGFGGHGARLTMHFQYRRLGNNATGLFQNYRDFVQSGFSPEQYRYLERRLKLGYPLNNRARMNSEGQAA